MTNITFIKVIFWHAFKYSLAKSTKMKIHRNIIKDSQKDKQVNINTVKLNFKRWHKDGR